MPELVLVAGGQKWRDRAACKGFQKFFFSPRDARPDFYDTARAICATCPVVAECAEYTRQDPPEEGFWHGVLYSRGRPVKPKKKPGRPKKQENAL